MTTNSIENCDGCSACCELVGCPPFLLELDGDTMQPIGGADSIADHERLVAAPVEARTAYLQSLGAINCQCAWLDATEGRCRYYEFRPDICRTIEVGGAFCLRLRELLQIG